MRPFPQRLATPAPIGTLFKQSERIVRMPAIDVATDAYLDAIRQLPCLKCMMEPSEAAHVRLNSAALTSDRPLPPRSGMQA